MTNPAACSIENLSGTGNVRCAAEVARAAKPPKVSAMTRSPESKPLPCGAERTVPATSAPGVNGGGGLIWYWPRVSSRSGKATPAASTSIRTPSPCSGSATSASSSAPGPLSSVTWRARTREPPVALARVGADERLGHAHRLVAVLALEGELGGDLHAALHVVDRGELGPHPHLAAHRQRRREADEVEAVVHREGEALEGEQPVREHRGERERVVAVRDRPAEGRLL